MPTRQPAIAQEAMESLDQHMSTLQSQTPRSIGAPGLMQVKTKYSTAVKGIEPRIMKDVERRCLEEAALMGDSCYYSWKQGGKIIEGLAVGAALMAIRNWGNCAVDVVVESPDPDADIFYAAFVDLETGFNLVRPFRQRREAPRKKSGESTYDGDRGLDVVYQIGASKAIRNVALNALPTWLKDEIMNKGKENVTAKINKMGIEKAKDMVKTKANSLGINLERLEVVYGKEKGWSTKDVVMISSALRNIEDGFEKDTELFPERVGTAEPMKQEQPKEKSKDSTPQQEQPKDSPLSVPAEYGVKEFEDIASRIDACTTQDAIMEIYNSTIQRKRSDGIITEIQYETLTQRMKERGRELKKSKSK